MNIPINKNVLITRLSITLRQLSERFVADFNERKKSTPVSWPAGYYHGKADAAGWAIALAVDLGLANYCFSKQSAEKKRDTVRQCPNIKAFYVEQYPEINFEDLLPVEQPELHEVAA